MEKVDDLGPKTIQKWCGTDFNKKKRCGRHSLCDSLCHVTCTKLRTVQRKSCRKSCCHMPGGKVGTRFIYFWILVHIDFVDIRRLSDSRGRLTLKMVPNLGDSGPSSMLRVLLHVLFRIKSSRDCPRFSFVVGLRFCHKFCGMFCGCFVGARLRTKGGAKR